MDHSYSDVRAKIYFFQPSDRQNFANALGQTCILDLRLRLHHISGQNCSGAISGWMGRDGLDLCVGLLYEHRFAVLINIHIHSVASI